jgi:class 3 adenylate cyclase
LPRVRIGINTGEVVTDGADPLGAAVNAAARIAGRAGGGEVLVSDVVRQLVGAVPAVRFLDRGRCRLKGFSVRYVEIVPDVRVVQAVDFVPTARPSPAR